MNWYHDSWSPDEDTTAVSSPECGSLHSGSSMIHDDHTTISSMDDNAARDLSKGFSIEEQSIKDPRDLSWSRDSWSPDDAAVSFPKGGSFLHYGSSTIHDNHTTISFMDEVPNVGLNGNERAPRRK